MKKILIIPVLFYCLSAAGQKVQCGTKDSSYNILKQRFDTITTVRVITDTIRIDTTVPVYCDTTAPVIRNPAVFPLNSYLTASVANPYPVVNLEALKIDTSKLTSVLSYGAKGDGRTYDDDAIVAAIKAASVGIIFPRNRTFLVRKTNRININKDLIIWAYGATIKMADFTRYSFLSLEYGSPRNCIWLGGTFDGNRNRQAYPNSPTGNNTWQEAHGRFLGISFAGFALVKDVTLNNIVMDGVGLDACRLSMVTDCKAYNGAPFHYEKLRAQGFQPDQGSSFKATRPGYKTAYFNNLICDGGSIGVHCSYPTAQTMDTGTIAVITNSRFNNQAQDAIHIEDCYKNFLYKDTITGSATTSLDPRTRTQTPAYNPKVHFSNRTGFASVRNCLLVNGRVSFHNAANLKIGAIDSCSFTSTWTNSNLQSFVTNATHVINSSFKGRTQLEQVFSRYTRTSTFTDFGNQNAIRAGRGIVDSCTFINGTKPVLISDDGLLFNCKFINVSSPNTNRIPPNDLWKVNFRDYISLIDDKNNWLGNIKLGL